jgi:hypothetical protein
VNMTERHIQVSLQRARSSFVSGDGSEEEDEIQNLDSADEGVFICATIC